MDAYDSDRLQQAILDEALEISHETFGMSLDELRSYREDLHADLTRSNNFADGSPV